MIAAFRQSRFAVSRFDPPSFRGGDDTPAAPETAATLSAASITGDTLSVTSDKAGTLYLTLVPSGEATPSAAQVVAGEKADGSAAPYTGSQAITDGANSLTFDTSSAADGEYKHCLVQTVTGGAVSNVLAPVATIDNTAPVRGTMVLAADGVTLTIPYNETLAGSVAAGEYTVQADASGVAVSAASISGTDVTLTLGAAVLSGQTVTVAYTGTSLTDAATPGNTAATFTATGATNNSTQTAGYTASMVDSQGTASVQAESTAFTAQPSMTLSFLAASDAVDTNYIMGSTVVFVKKVNPGGFQLVTNRAGGGTDQYNATFTDVLSSDPASPTHVHIRISYGATSGDEGDSFAEVYLDGVLTAPDSGGLVAGEAWGDMFSYLDFGFASRSGGSLKSDVYLGNVYLEFGAARPVADFYDGGPKDLTGVGSPQVLINGDASDWNAGTNAGSGGALTVNSATFVDA